MDDRLLEEIALVQRRFGEVEVGPGGDWLILAGVDLPSGWSKARTRVLIRMPGGYPTTPPDNFWADEDLRLADGGLPGASSPNQPMGNGTWLLFSYHVEQSDWHPAVIPSDGHTLVTFLDGVVRRLGEPN